MRELEQAEAHLLQGFDLLVRQYTRIVAMNMLICGLQAFSFVLLLFSDHPVLAPLPALGALFSVRETRGCIAVRKAVRANRDELRRHIAEVKHG